MNAITTSSDRTKTGWILVSIATMLTASIIFGFIIILKVLLKMELALGRMYFRIYLFGFLRYLS